MAKFKEVLDNIERYSKTDLLLRTDIIVGVRTSHAIYNRVESKGNIPYWRKLMSITEPQKNKLIKLGYDHENRVY